MHSFNIGVFPYAMICSLILFVDPHTPAVVWNALMGLPPPILPRPDRPSPLKDDKTVRDQKVEVNAMSDLVF